MGSKSYVNLYSKYGGAANAFAAKCLDTAQPVKGRIRRRFASIEAAIRSSRCR